MEIPILENPWRSNTMKAWSSNHGWESDKDIPILPESMLYVISQDSQFKIQHETLLNKSDSTTERASREVFKCSSSLEGDEEQKSKSSKEAEGERILIITNTSNDAKNNQILEGRIHPDFDILQETAQEHHAESQIARRIHEEVQFGGTKLKQQK
ncbi:hypothetical protein Hanom_Chr12g01101021 [Helianthus anomalus]